MSAFAFQAQKNSSTAVEIRPSELPIIQLDWQPSGRASYLSFACNATEIVTLLPIILLSLCVSRTLYILFIRPLFSPLRGLPSPNQGFPLLRLLHEPKVTELEAWLETIPNNGLIRYFGLWNEERIFAASPDAIKDILVSQPYNYVKPKLQYQLVKNVAAAGLLLQEGLEHKGARKNFGPAFHADRVRAAYSMMWKSAIDLADEVDRQSQKETSNKPTGMASILKPLSAVSIDIIGHWAFSRSFNCVKDYAGSHFGKPYVEVLKTTHRGQWILDLATKIGPEVAMAVPLKAVKTIKAIVALVIQTSTDIVDEHEETFKHGSLASKDDMLSSIMATGHFSHTDLIVQTVHFLAAGTETVAGSTAWTMHLLSRHTEVQDRLREEIRRHLPSLSPDEDASGLYSALERLPYLNAVIKEALRFHSINTILWRQCVAPDSVILGHHMPVGIKVVFSPWATNRDTRVWGPDAKVFNPDRWIKAVNGGANSNYSFLTFGAGPRRCIGESFAKTEMRCLIAVLVGRFEFSPVEELEGGKGSDDGTEVGDNHALTLFKILEGWKMKCKRVGGW